MNNFGARLKELRTECRLRQSDLAGAVDVQPSYISRLETGSSTPSNSLIEALAHCTGYSYHWLKYGEGPRFGEEGMKICSNIGRDSANLRKAYIEEYSKSQLLVARTSRKNRPSPRETLIAALIDYFYRHALPVPVEIPSHEAQKYPEYFPFASPDFSLNIISCSVSKWAFYTYASQIQKPTRSSLWQAEQALFQIIGKLSTQLMQQDVKYSFVIDDDRFLQQIEKYQFNNLNATLSVIILHPFSNETPNEKYLSFHRNADTFFLENGLTIMPMNALPIRPS